MGRVMYVCEVCRAGFWAADKAYIKVRRFCSTRCRNASQSRAYKERNREAALAKRGGCS